MNILITTNCEHKKIVKLADLGDSRFISAPELKARNVIGTPLYMPPEIVRQDIYDNKVFFLVQVVG